MSEAWSVCPSAVVFVIDRLSPAFLGPYGNTWLESPAFCRVASEGIVAEMVIAHTPNLAGSYAAYWQGWKGVAGLFRQLKQGTATASDIDFAFLQAIKESGRKTILLTDDPAVAELPGASLFEECILLQQPVTVQPANEVEATDLARITAEAVTLISSSEGPFFLWVHSRGMSGPWDAPLEFRNQFADEDDPLPGDFVEPPQQLVPKDVDPDELLAVQHAYAGQVSLLDLCLEEVLATVEALPAERRALLAITSPRGYPLGEHHQIGPVRDDLYNELIQLPLIVRHPDKFAQLARVQELLQPADLHTTLIEALQLSSLAAQPAPSGGILALAQQPVESLRAIAVCLAEKEWAVRTYAWLLRQKSLTLHSAEQSADDKVSAGELYVKPDDRYEVVEIASRCSQVPPQMMEQAAAFLASLEQGQPDASVSKFPQLSDTWH